MEGCLPGGTRPNTPHHHMGLWLQATVQMRLCRGCAQGGVWWKRVGGRAGARQGRTAQNSGRMFVFAATLVPRRRDIRHGNVGERENLNPGNHRDASAAEVRDRNRRNAAAQIFFLFGLDAQCGVRFDTALVAPATGSTHPLSDSALGMWSTLRSPDNTHSSPQNNK